MGLTTLDIPEHIKKDCKKRGVMLKRIFLMGYERLQYDNTTPFKEQVAALERKVELTQRLAAKYYTRCVELEEKMDKLIKLGAKK
jgi:hypothetical protein